MNQLSIFINNSTGSISDCVSILDDNNIEIYALSVSDALDYGILRLIVDKPNEAYDLIKKNGYNAKLANTIGFYLKKEEKLSNILKELKNNNISVTYIYSFKRNINDLSAYIVKTPNLDVTKELLKKNNISLIEDDFVVED